MPAPGITSFIIRKNDKRNRSSTNRSLNTRREQCAVREADNRRLLFELDMSVQRLTGLNADNPEIGPLTACYSNLLRKWAEI